MDSLIKHQLITSDNSIRNTYVAKEKINNNNILPGCKMISLDLKNPNTSIPNFKVLKIFKNKFTYNSSLIDKISMTKLCIPFML